MGAASGVKVVHYGKQEKKREQSHTAADDAEPPHHILVVAGALTSPAEPVSAADPVLVGAGDIADCDRSGDEATANILDTVPGTVFTIGDNVYRSGTATEFANCYAPSSQITTRRTIAQAVGDHGCGTARHFAQIFVLLVRPLAMPSRGTTAMTSVPGTL